MPTWERRGRSLSRVDRPRRWLGLASWIGGDRDGNPYVTAAVTAETLRLHRGLAVEQHRRALQDLARRLSLSERRLPPPRRSRRGSRASARCRSALRTSSVGTARSLSHRAVAARRRSLAASAEDMRARLRRPRRTRRASAPRRWRACSDLIAAAVPASLAEDRLRTVRTRSTCLASTPPPGSPGGCEPPCLGVRSAPPRPGPGAGDPAATGAERGGVLGALLGGAQPATAAAGRSRGARRRGAGDVGAVPAPRAGPRRLRARADQAVRDLDGTIGG